MPILTYDFSDVVAFGADRSSIGAAVRRAGKPLGVSVADDPVPDEGNFVRSDHYRFVEQGVPAVFLATGPGGRGMDAGAAFLKQNYHRPSDDLAQPIDYGAGAKFAQLNYAIARELADDDIRPFWKKGDFFAGRFGGGTLTAPAAQ
jgi:Zn-dependent M28 family amino/carboxypeptidase